MELSLKGAYEEARRTPKMAEVGDRLRQAGVDEERVAAVVERVEGPPAAEVLRLRKQLKLPQGHLEHYLLLAAGAASFSRLRELPVPGDVRDLMERDLTTLVNPKSYQKRLFDATEYGFTALCKLVTLRRFPAGQLDWEVSGIPRSKLVGGLCRSPRAGLRLLRVVYGELGGRGPVFWPHVVIMRRMLALREVEHYRAFHRMARALELQPEVRGIASGGWLHSPDTHAVSPHLAWFNVPFLYRDTGVVVRTGLATEDSGVFTGAGERRRRFEAGEFTPTTALVVVPRKAAIAWAHEHPQYGP